MRGLVVLGRQIDCGIAIEETYRMQCEPTVFNRHDRPVLGTRQVRYARGVPNNDVLVDDVLIRF